MAPHRILAHKNVHNRIKISLGIYSAVSLVMLGVLISKTISGGVSAKFAIGGVLIGAIIGIFFSRMYKMSWNEEIGKVISHIDLFGGIVLALFILFDIFHGKLVGLFVFNSAWPIASFAVATGVVYGRIIGFRGSVRRVLRKQRMA